MLACPRRIGANHLLHVVSPSPRIDLACFTGRSGLTDYSVSLARAMASKATVRLHTAHDISPRFTKMGFEVLKSFRRSRHYPVDVIRFALRILRDKPDLVLFQAQLKFPLIEGLLILLFRLAGIRTALTIHDVLPHYPRYWSAREFAWFYQRFDCLIAHSQVAQAQIRAMGVTRPVLVVPHGIYDIFNLDNPSPATSRAHIPELNPQDTVVLFFGHLEPRKGLLEFLDTARSLQANQSIKFLIAGGNDMAKHHASDADQFEQGRLLKNVVIHDHRIPFEEVQHYFKASNIVALPYREGTTSGVLKLALAFGVPVIVSKVGDLPEQVPPRGGITIDSGPQMAEQLQDAILKITENQSYYQEGMRQAAHQASWSDIAEQYIAFFQNSAAPSPCQNS